MEGGEDKKLRNANQSLEEEILDHNSIPETCEGSPSLDQDLMVSGSTSSDSFDFSWTTDYMTNYLEHGVEEFARIKNHSQDYRVPFEKIGYIFVARN